MAFGAAPAGSVRGGAHHRIALRRLQHASSSMRPNVFLHRPPFPPPSLWQLRRAEFRFHTNTHLCGTYTATNAPADTTGTALGPACSSQVLQTVALMAFRDRLTAGQAAVSTWNMANKILVREARAPPPPGCKAVQGPSCTLCS